MGLEDAWADLHAATPLGWFVGRPGQRRGGQWAMYASGQDFRYAERSR